jgi:16S rRNA (uracil1498-N3)-methyltransferase
MPQFLIKSIDIINNKYLIKGEDYYHLTKVRRARTGELVDLRGDDGYYYKGKISEITNEYIALEIIKTDNISGQSFELSLYVSLLKGKKFDLILQKATELGVRRIIPVLAERSIPDISRKENKKIRWEKIVSEAFKQCMRERIPVVEGAMMFKEAVLNSQSAIKIIAHPDINGRNIKVILAGKDRTSDVSVLIGPEGGFSENEIAIAKENSWEQAVFGFTSLRAETAAIVIPAILVYEWSLDDNKS